MGSMASPFFSNNAPPPIPGGYGNPTGANIGFNIGATGKPSTSGAPAFPMFGPSNQTGLNASPFGTSNTGMAGLSSGLSGIGGVAAPGSKDDNLGHELVHAYGEGTGNAILQLLYKGMFNPQTAQAFLSAMQPGVQRGQADILNAFGAGGQRFSSSAALGLGDFMSQVNLNENQTLAQMFEHSQDQELSLLQGIQDTMHAENANKGGIWQSILGAAAPFASMIPGVGPILGGLMSGVSGASSGGFASAAQGIRGLFGGRGASGFDGPTGGSYADTDW